MNVFIWLGLLLLFIIIEAQSVSLMSMWFALGSLAALAVYFLQGPLWLQITVFIVVSAALLISLWPLTRKFLNPRITKTNVDSVIGSTGYVTISVDNMKAEGQVKLGAMVWTARSTSGEPIPEGTLVRADRIEGVKVFVTPVEIPANV